MSKQKTIQLHLSFGSHSGRRNAKQFKKDFKMHKPVVYAPETGGLLASERISYMRKYNDRLKKARKSPRNRERFLRALHVDDLKQGICLEDAAFRSAEQALIVDSGARVYVVEALPVRELVRVERARQKYNMSMTFVLEMLNQGEIEMALRMYSLALRVFAKYEITTRNTHVVRGFERMSGELVRLFPELEDVDPIRVFSRYGLAHLSIGGAIAKNGFKTTVSVDSPFRFEGRLLMRLCSNPNALFSRAELLQGLFTNIDSNRVGLDVGKYSRTEAEDVEVETALFRRLGGARGFTRLLNVSSLGKTDYLEVIYEELDRIDAEIGMHRKVQ